MAEKSLRGTRRNGPRDGSGRALQTIAVLHPVPSAINAALVASLSVVAGAGPSVTVALAVAMLGFQFSIGSLNDIVDSGTDRLAKPRKPIPAGLVSVRAAAAIAIAGGALGLAVSAAFGAVVLLLGAAGYASGLAYDVYMRPRGMGWLCYSAAFPLLLAWTWMAAAGNLPPSFGFLLPMAALAGPAIAIANSLVDEEHDRSTGRTSLATRLGPERARWLLAILTGTIYGLAWAALAGLSAAPSLAVTGALLATSAAAIGVVLSWQGEMRLREGGWLLQALGLATMAVVLLASLV